MAGAEVSGIDLKRLDNRAFNRIHRALLEHRVLGIGAQAMSAGDLVAFARRLGEPQAEPRREFQHPLHPEILVLSNAVDDGFPRGFRDNGPIWLLDGAPRAGGPHVVTLIYALEIPAECEDSVAGDISDARHQPKPGAGYRRPVRAGDAIAWDQRCSLRFATGGDAAHRTLYRIVVAGAA